MTRLRSLAGTLILIAQLTAATCLLLVASIIPAPRRSKQLANQSADRLGGAVHIHSRPTIRQEN